MGLAPKSKRAPQLGPSIAYGISQMRDAWQRTRMLFSAAVFGKNVRRERQANGLTLEAMADEVGLAYSYLGEIERGRKNPTLDVVERIAEVLETDPLELLRARR